MNCGVDLHLGFLQHFLPILVQTLFIFKPCLVLNGLPSALKEKLEYLTANKVPRVPRCPSVQVPKCGV